MSGAEQPGWADEVAIAKLPAGWLFRVVPEADGSAVLKGIRSQDGAPPPAHIRRQLTRRLGGSDHA